MTGCTLVHGFRGAFRWGARRVGGGEEARIAGDGVVLSNRLFGLASVGQTSYDKAS